MKTIKTRNLDEIADQDGNVDMTYEYDFYYFSEDGKEFPKLVAKSYTDTAYEVVFKSIDIAEFDTISITPSEISSDFFQSAIEYLKKEGKKRIGSFIDGLPGYYLIWSALEGEQPGLEMNKLAPLDNDN